MANPSRDALLGGDLDLSGTNPENVYERVGVHAAYPAFTPKYHTGAGIDPPLERMARMFIPFADKAAREAFIRSVPNGEAQTLARVLAASGQGTTDREGLGYIDFFLQNAQESLQEKFQVADILGDNYVSYFFGSQPPVFNYTGVLMNTYQDNWRNAFTLMYNMLIRGSMLARNKVVVSLAYDDVIVTGALLNLTETLSADNEMAVPFTFSMLVKEYTFYPRAPAPGLIRPTLLNSQEFAFASAINVLMPKGSELSAAPYSIFNAGDPAYTTQTRQKDQIGDAEDEYTFQTPSPSDANRTYIRNTVYEGAQAGVEGVASKFAVEVEVTPNVSEENIDDILNPQSVPEG